LSDGLKVIFGPTNVATEGVDYLGLPQTNFVTGGADLAGIGLMQVLLSTAATLCPSSVIVASGYSQGAALTHRAIEGLNQNIKDRIAGVVTFGDTQTLQDGEHILGYPLNKTLIICNQGDVICAGTLWVVPIHFDYTRRVPEGVAFLFERIMAAGGKPKGLGKG
jgi:cutinase